MDRNGGTTVSSTPRRTDNDEHHHDEDVGSDVDSLADVGQWQKKRRRSTKDYLVTIPRTDIRRLYPRMMMNIFNGHDPLLVHSFFMTYSMPSMAATYESFGSINLSQAPTRTYVSATPTYLHGPHRMALFYATMLQLNPDQIMRVHSAKARVDTDRRVTKISCIMEHEFTQLYAVNPMQITDEIVNFIVAEEAAKQQAATTAAMTAGVASSSLISDTASASLSSDHDEMDDVEHDAEDDDAEDDDEADEDGDVAPGTSSSLAASTSTATSVSGPQGHDLPRGASSSPSLTTASSSSSLSSTTKLRRPPPRTEERRRSRKKMSRRTVVHDDRDIVFPDTFDMYRRIFHADVPRMEKPPSIRIRYEYVIVVDALRRLLLVDFQNPQVTVVV